LIHRLVLENLKHRPVLTLLSAVFIGISVTMILTLVGLSDGMLGEIAARSKGTGADILVRPPGSSVLAFSMVMPEGVVNVVRATPHVDMATGALVQSIGTFDSITGINLDEFNRMSGGLKFLKGGPFSKPGDLVIDEVYANAKKLHVGDNTAGLGLAYRVSGIVEQGKLARMFAPLDYLQDTYSQKNKVSIIYVKVDDPANIGQVLDALTKRLDDYKIFRMDDFVSLISVDSIPLLKQFTGVVIGLGVVIGFLVVFLAMYMAVLERTREIGILKALGASPGYIMGILLREAVILAIIGTIVGIILTFGTRSVIHVFAPTWTTSIVKSWWPRAGLIALTASLIGAIYPGLKAARQDAIEALSYD
jgi:putative ABC transport system permease protein